MLSSGTTKRPLVSTPAVRVRRSLPRRSSRFWPGTVGVGYNTIRFDDKITRLMFWCNLINPYAREWQNECGRWDILNVVRTAYALRFEGIQWLVNANGAALGH
jgi:exonuclease I